MKFTKGLLGAALLAIALAPAPRASAVVLGQIDTFQDGTTQGWLAGLLGAPHPAPPINIPTGGPKGAGDRYLQLTALGGVGPGSRLTVLNLSQWSGDYLSAGVHFITMDVNNLGTGDLSLRLLFEDPMGGPPNDVAFSTDPVLVPAGSGWMSVVFPVGPDALTAGLGSVTTALSNTTALRIFHSPSPGFPGPSVVAQIGVDNIKAVPEPSAALLIGAGLLALLITRRRSVLALARARRR